MRHHCCCFFSLQYSRTGATDGNVAQLDDKRGGVFREVQKPFKPITTNKCILQHTKKCQLFYDRREGNLLEEFTGNRIVLLMY